MSSVAKNISLVSPYATAGVWPQAAAPRIAETLSQRPARISPPHPHLTGEETEAYRG